jgi:hypothetical protein
MPSAHLPPCLLLAHGQVNPLAKDAEGKLIAADMSARLPPCLPLAHHQVNVFTLNHAAG